MKLLLSLIILLCITNCSDEKKFDKNTLIVGTSADNPPYEYIKDGEVIGLDIDIIKAIANKLNKKIAVKNMAFHELLGALDKNQVDMVICGLSVTPERSLRVNFSEPYMTSKMAILHKVSDKFSSYDDLTDKMIGVQVGTVQGQIARNLSKKKHHRVRSSPDSLRLIEELKTGKIDAIMMEKAQAENYGKTHQGLTHFVLEDRSSKFAIALPRSEDPTLKDSINNAIRTLMTSGVIDALQEKWLNQ